MEETGLTIAFIGCGKSKATWAAPSSPASWTPSSPCCPTAWPTRPPEKLSTFIACTKTTGSATRLQQEFAQHATRLRVVAAQNVSAIDAADIVILGCKPYLAKDVLQEPGVRAALAGKLLVSMLGGTTLQDLEDMVRGGPLDDELQHVQPPYLAKAVPNIAARYCQSITILEESAPALPPREAELLEWVFNQVGTVKYLPEPLVNVGSMLITTVLARCRSRSKACWMGAWWRGIMSLGAMLANGTHPAVMRESISSPRGCTIQSLLTVEKAATRAVFAQALIDGTEHLKPKEEKKK
ncbi:hypothetical protein G7046_g8060 [Stylonectria norvegica]|nr:hypothetical protein G7046_g8060 [Stylonectria norvegica]